MFVGRSSGRRLVAAALVGVLPIGLCACGLLIGLDDHQAFPSVDAGEDVDERPDAQPDAVEDAPPDVGPDGCSGTVCNDLCVDTNTSADHCGACNAPCSANVACTAGVCGDHIDQISAGSNHGCALLHDGSIWCWGSDGSGQLGIPPAKDTTCNGGFPCQPTPTRVEGLPPKMIQVSAGADFTCGIQEGGKVWCWGSNTWLQLGRATNGGSPSVNYDRTPLPVPGLGPVAQVTTGNEFACARLADGTGIYCWGSNVSGTLGNGMKEGGMTGVAPGIVASLPTSGLLDVSAGLGNHACALTGTHEVWCWGDNGHGQLGHSSANDTAVCPTTKCTSAPSLVPSLIVSQDRITASALSTCAETSTGLACWGGNIYAQLGIVPDSLEHSVPTIVSGIPAAAMGTFRSGYGISSVITDSGIALWGDDTYGGLGRGMITKLACSGGGHCDPTPSQVTPANGLAPRQIATGAFWAMALVGNQIFAWGANLDGRIGHAPNTGSPQDYTDCGYDGMQICNPTPQLIPQPGGSP